MVFSPTYQSLTICVNDSNPESEAQKQNVGRVLTNFCPPAAIKPKLASPDGAARSAAGFAQAALRHRIRKAMANGLQFTVRKSGATYLALALLSGSALAFEISLSRLFSIQQFHHFAFMVISLAVMGIAASGTLLALRKLRTPLWLLAALYALSLALTYLLLNFLPFDSYSIAWDRRQIFILVLYFLCAGIPFLLSGWVTGSCLAQAAGQAHQAYAASLAGSALGCLLALAAHAILGVEGAMALCVALGFVSAAIFSKQARLRFPLALLAMLAGFLSMRFPKALSLRLSPYKPLSVAMLALDARHTLVRRDLSSRLDLVESATLHVYPGLSLNAGGDLPLQAGIFIDGEGPVPITALSPDAPSAADFARHMPASIAYQLRPAARAIILSPGAGLDAIVALASGAASVAISDPQPLIADVLQGPYRQFSQGLLDLPQVTLIQRGDRGALRASRSCYNIVQFSLSSPYHPVTSGAFSLTEDFSLTVESFREAYQALCPDGLLVITRWLGTPPSESARAWATLLQAIRPFHATDLTPYLLAFRGMRTATMLAARQPFTPQELAASRSFLEQNAFDPIILPDLTPDELNRHNRLPVDTYHEVYDAILHNAEEFLPAYEFNLQPSTDDKPFFFHFFRWSQTPEVLATLGYTWQPFGGSGYLVLLLLLGTVSVFAVPLAIAPLLILKRQAGLPRPGASALAFFAFLGAGYLLVEIPLIQRLTLLLDHPTLAMATVLFTLLLTSGLGSLFSTRLPLRLSLLILVGALLLTLAILPAIVGIAVAWPPMARFVLSVLLLAPCGFLMGIPFAAGLRRLEEQHHGQVAWAWAINGSASGIAGVLTALLTLDLGFAVTLAIGALAYLGAALTSRRLTQASRALR
jgi:hypothetical protein